jgi:hypothetical protein
MDSIGMRGEGLDEGRFGGIRCEQSERLGCEQSAQAAQLIDGRPHVSLRRKRIGANEYRSAEDVGGGVRVGIGKDRFENPVGIIENPNFKMDVD